MGLTSSKLQFLRLAAVSQFAASLGHDVTEYTGYLYLLFIVDDRSSYTLHAPTWIQIEVKKQNKNLSCLNTFLKNAAACRFLVHSLNKKCKWATTESSLIIHPISFTPVATDLQLKKNADVFNYKLFFLIIFHYHEFS